MKILEQVQIIDWIRENRRRLEEVGTTLRNLARDASRRFGRQISVESIKLLVIASGVRIKTRRPSAAGLYGGLLDSIVKLLEESNFTDEALDRFLEDDSIPVMIHDCLQKLKWDRDRRRRWADRVGPERAEAVPGCEVADWPGAFVCDGGQDG